MSRRRHRKWRPDALQQLREQSALDPVRPRRPMPRQPARRHAFTTLRDPIAQMRHEAGMVTFGRLAGYVAGYNAAARDEARMRAPTEAWCTLAGMIVGALGPHIATDLGWMVARMVGGWR